MIIGKVTLRHTRKSPIIRGRSKQRKLDRFTSVLGKVKERVSKYVPSFKTPKSSLYTGDKLTEIEAELYMFITGITTHLTAITAYHVGRTDLMRSPTAFRRISLG